MTFLTYGFQRLDLLRATFRARFLTARPSDMDPPLRADLLSADQMERYGRTLAAAHRLTTHKVRDQLLPRLAANEAILTESCRQLTAAVSANHRISPAGEWLLDNFHLVEEQIATAKRHLPRGYSRELPRLALGPSAGLPRVYDIALETISHGDGRIDADTLNRFVAAYQTVTVLKLGELWAIPIMLRLALIENLRRVAVRVTSGRADRDVANEWADRMMETAERDPKCLILVIADMARSVPPMRSSFVAELARRLQGQSAALALALTWIEQQLADTHQTIEQLVQAENQQQAAAQVSVSNSIASLRSLNAIEWREFVEKRSAVEAILRQDPEGVYSAMDFGTRDCYRHAVERIAKESGKAETDVAGAAIRLAQASADAGGNDDRAAHVGFHLIGNGLPGLESAAGVNATPFALLANAARRFPLAIYLGGIGAITGLVTAGLAAHALHGGTSAAVVVASLALMLLVSSQAAVTLVNWIAALLVPPRSLPRMDFARGIPAPLRTLVVIPTMLTSTHNVDALIDALEVRFLANRDPQLHFGLLTDFSDAPQETLPEDAPMLRLAEARIAELNLKYAPSDSTEGGPGDGSVFYLFHRRRRWNADAGLWMGFERKRGKLSELNSLLRNGPHDDFSLIVGATAVLGEVKYVITLDTDTALPRDAARQFVGAMAHPLNTPRFDEPGRNTSREVVTSGYGILQPRVSVSLPGTNRSLYARLYGGDTGIDPYTRTVSDVYQDVFGEGSFIGKGIYDVDAVERVLKGRFPANRILSHDLLEGCYARAGLLSDAHLYEEIPARYSADVARRRRWIRGDWQLAGWLGRRVQGEAGRGELNPLSMLSQWKLFDNLRRSLVPVAYTSLLLLGWTVFRPGSFWTAIVIGTLLIPAIIATLADLVDVPAEVPLKLHLVAVLRGARRCAGQALLALAFLPYETFYCLDAILRTVGRLVVTRRRLLEWNPSSEVDRAMEHGDHASLSAAYRAMWVAPAIAGIAWTGLCLVDAMALAIATPVLLLWAASPAIAWWISRPIPRQDEGISAGQVRFLRELARRTWAYFETYVGPDDNWLPPDNMQEHPAFRVAHRTSPTNMGMALLANLAAHDFGYCSTGTVVARTENALRTMDSLERYRGHFYNWYDTGTCRPLAPHYVSTVDSGNLVGHLLTLRPGLLALIDAPVLNPEWRAGLADTFRVLAEALAKDPPAAAMATVMAQFESALLLAASPAGAPAGLAEAWTHAERLAVRAGGVAAAVAAAHPGTADDAGFWAVALARQCDEWRDELLLLAPWLALRLQADVAATLPGARGIPSLRELAAALPPRPAAPDDTVAGGAGEAADPLAALVAAGAEGAAARMAALEALALHATAYTTLDYDFLYDKVRRQLVIGCNISDKRCDTAYYDLLASEARLCNFVAIAQGKLPQESWFALGRLLTSAGGEPVLLSWSGSMFEYLMPLLVMPTYPNTLLDQTYRSAVARQIDYGRQRRVPWGMSESGYNTTDVNLNYQYRAFGVPGLGLKRGLGEDLVVAPYASALALMVAPEAACHNLKRLAGAGLAGRLGLHEAIDYTPSRQRRGETSAVVRSYMAHHQSMSLLALAYALLGRPMQKRFEAEPQLQATLLLLQERIPRATWFHPLAADVSGARVIGTGPEMPVRTFKTPDTALPEVQLLSNGRYHVMVTHAGGGSSRWKDLAMTRWREDATSDNWGTFCYLREPASGKYWSTAFQPTLTQPDHYEAIFSEGRAEFRRRDADFDTHTEIVVSPEDDIEVRRVRVTNRSRAARTIEITSYAEIVLAPAAADALHPAFSNLFVQTELLEARRAIVCTRRPRSHAEQVPWMFHVLTVHGAHAPGISFETDRMRFIGRGGSVAAPAAMTVPGPLSGTQGAVLDPIAAIRHRLVIAPGATATVDMVSGMAETREAVLVLVDKYQDPRLADRVFELTWTHSQVVLRQLNATEADSQLYGQLAGAVIYANASLRAPASVLVRNRRGQSGLWGYAISGDLPIVLLQIGDAANIEIVRQLVQAHAYWRLKGLVVDLVIWNEEHNGYRQKLQEQIVGLIAAGVESQVVDRPGGIFVRQAEQISPEDRILFQSVARAIIADRLGTLSEQLDRRVPVAARMPQFVPTRTYRPKAEAPPGPAATGLTLFNGTGGFAADGREYVIAPPAGEPTPVPWANVLANAQFGTVVSESGLGYTWSGNAQMFRLTPWHNDSVGESSGEAMYVRDEETGHFWSPTSLVCGGAAPQRARHGFGYSVFERTEDGIHTELTLFCALDAPVKFFSLQVSNHSGRARRLSVTGYVEWVLGDLRAKSAMHVTTEIDARTGAVFARNPFNGDFADHIAFFDVDDTVRSVTGDRTEFLGRNGTLRNPAALRSRCLSGRTGAALDPCAAIQVPLELLDGQERGIVFRLGAGRDAAAAGMLAQRFRGAIATSAALQAVVGYWTHTLSAVQVATPDPALNVLANGWLVYQTLACRMWGRSGYYQSGGAFGFRDQLQDAMALVHCEPGLVRAHIVRCAGRQFIEGDVQHWWHPPSGRGVRTHCSDDYLWLPLATCRYVRSTGDHSVLDEAAASLEGRPVNAGEDSYYDLPARSDDSASVYEHCRRAILHGLRFGAQGLPLMGSGDWNDGMNLVGIGGKGESVWLAFFLCHVLREFAPLARRRDDPAFADRCEESARQLARHIEASAWDGDWYRRAWFDDGTPLGSSSNAECSIDSVAQSWSVLSGSADGPRSRQAMAALHARLVHADTGLVQLLDPPFDNSGLDPGYIRGYVPGVRENGGQYTHAAVWAAMAFAALGDNTRAWELTAMINPANHARTPEAVATYKVEPYAVAADIYARAPHAGRGGWTWYTGSAGWMYRLITESVLGLTLEADRLRIAPCMPPHWESFSLRYRFLDAWYDIAVRRIRVDGDAAPDSVTVTVDGTQQADNVAMLAGDGQSHRIDVNVETRRPPEAAV